MRIFVVVILNFILCCSVFAQKPYVTLTINPAIVESGDEFTIEVKTNISGKVSIDNLPSSFTPMNYGESSTTAIDPATGNLDLMMVYSYTGSIDNPGDYSFGPAYVTSGVGSSSSKKVNLTVEKEMVMYSGDITNTNLRKPAFGLIQTNKKSIYEGEALVASAKIYSKSYAKVVNSKSYEIKGAIDFHPIGDPNRLSIKEERIKGIPFVTFEYDKKLIFPTGSGSVKIEPFQAKLLYPFDQLKLNSSYTTVTIVPLPSNPPKDFIGGVGNFSIHRETKAGNLKQGDVFKMIITVYGSGNIQNTTDPALNLPKGMVVYGDPVVNQDYRFNNHGCTGNIQYEYNIQVTGSGKVVISPASISYFDLLEEKYVTAVTDSLIISVKKNANFLATEKDKKTEVADENDVLKPSLKIEEELATKNNLFGSPLFWGGLSAPVLIAFLFVLFTKNQKRNEERLNEKGLLLNKERDFEKLLTQTQLELSNTSNDRFYSSMENALRKFIEIKMGAGIEHRLSKIEIQKFVQEHFGIQTSSRVNLIFNSCEQARFGLQSSTDDRIALFGEFKQLIEELK